MGGSASLENTHACRVETYLDTSSRAETNPLARVPARHARVRTPREVDLSSRPLVRPGSGADRWFEIKSQVHHKLLNSLTSEQLKDLNKDSVRGQIGAVVEKLIIDDALPMTMGEREKLT